MLTIDVHTHILPEEIPDFKAQFGYGGFIKLSHQRQGAAKMLRDDGVFFREVNANCWCPQHRLDDLAATNVDVQVLSTVPVMFNYWAKPKDTLVVAEFLNDHIAGIVKAQPQRFVGLATLPMQDSELAIQELRRCRLDLGLAGIQIGTHIEDRNLNHPEVFKILEACQELDAAVFVHPWDMMGKDRMPDYWLPWLVGMPAETSLAICSMIFGGIFERLPHLRVAFAHGGGSFPGTIGRIEHGFNVRPDLCAKDNSRNPRDYLGRFYVDSLVHDPEALATLIKLFGEDKVMLGSDYPFPLGEHRPGQIIRQQPNLSTQSQAKMLGGNALGWLGLTAAAFNKNSSKESR